MKISIQLVSLFCAIAFSSTTVFAQQKMAWEKQKMVFVLPDGEMKTIADDEKIFNVVGEKMFFKAELVTEASAKKDAIATLFKSMEMNKLELVNKGERFKTANGLVGHYMIGKGEQGFVAFVLFTMEKKEFPLLISFPVEQSEAKEEVMKLLMNMYNL